MPSSFAWKELSRSYPHRLINATLAAKYVLPPKTISYVAFVFILLLPHLSGTICFSIAVLFREK